MGRFVIFSLMVLFLSSVDAALYKGQKEYVKRCSKCHSDGHTFISKKTSAQWEEYMKNSAEELVKVHLNSSDENAKNSFDYFKNNKPEKNANHLMEFLMEYAKDSGKVPACN